MSWLDRHSTAIQSIAAIVTAMVALVALFAIRYQLDEADTIQRSQSARDAYRSHLALATTQPGFAVPADACELMQGQQAGAYEAFVDHLLYSAEQMLEIEQGWQPTFEAALLPHVSYVCSSSDLLLTASPATASFLKQFSARHCAAARSCQ